MRALAIALALLLLGLGCGQPTGQVKNEISPTGGEVCLPEDRICIAIPSGALERKVEISIGESSEAPTAPIGSVYEIGPSGTTFLVPAAVTLRYDLLPGFDAGEINPAVLRVFTTTESGEWVPLEEPTFDRRTYLIGGQVTHLSPFAVMRTDVRIDGGTDAGRTDSGIRDGGTDAGRTDSGVRDGGTDAGRPDSGTDAGRPDSGTDSGVPDAGFDAGVDAGADAGVDAGVDAGEDAGADAGDDAGFDAGDDAGAADSGPDDAGDGG